MTVCIDITVTLIIGKDKNNIWFLGRSEDEFEKGEKEQEQEDFHLITNMFYMHIIQLIP